MRFSSLRARGLRCFTSVDYAPVPLVNLIHGPNGSGKTSLLEAMHLVSFGKSFLTPKAGDLLKQGEDVLWIEARVQEITNYGPAGITVRKSRSETDIRFDGQAVTSASALARHMPLLVVNSRAPDLLGENPANRRALVDRSLFHVKPSYVDTWKHYRHALRQRNELLQASGRGNAQADYWESVLATLSVTIDEQRSALIEAINARLVDHGIASFVNQTLRFHYSPGWDRQQGLAAQLLANRERDTSLGYTFAGPHRADLSLQLDGRAAARRLSRGQAKAVVCLVMVAIAQFIRSQSQACPVMLVDDLAAEMDEGMMRLAVDAVLALETQCFFTAIKPADLRSFLPEATSEFHVEHQTH